MEDHEEAGIDALRYRHVDDNGDDELLTVRAVVVTIDRAAELHGELNGVVLLRIDNAALIRFADHELDGRRFFGSGIDVELRADHRNAILNVLYLLRRISRHLDIRSNGVRDRAFQLRDPVERAGGRTAGAVEICRHCGAEVLGVIFKGVLDLFDDRTRLSVLIDFIQLVVHGNRDLIHVERFAVIGVLAGAVCRDVARNGADAEENVVVAVLLQKVVRKTLGKHAVSRVFHADVEVVASAPHFLLPILDVPFNLVVAHAILAGALPRSGVLTGIFYPVEIFGVRRLQRLVRARIGPCLGQLAPLAVAVFGAVAEGADAEFVGAVGKVTVDKAGDAEVCHFQLIAEGPIRIPDRRCVAVFGGVKLDRKTVLRCFIGRKGHDAHARLGFFRDGIVLSVIVKDIIIPVFRVPRKVRRRRQFSKIGAHKIELERIVEVISAIAAELDSVAAGGRQVVRVGRERRVGAVFRIGDTKVCHCIDDARRTVEPYLCDLKAFKIFLSGNDVEHITLTADADLAVQISLGACGAAAVNAEVGRRNGHGKRRGNAVLCVGHSAVTLIGSGFKPDSAVFLRAADHAGEAEVAEVYASIFSLGPVEKGGGIEISA